MNTNELKSKINEYFEYIKTIYLNEFDKYISKEVKNDIVNIKDIVELRDDMPFKVHVHDSKITFNLDIKKFIEDNDLANPKSLMDLNDESKQYVKYILDNQNDVFEIIKNELLESILLVFTKNRKDVVTIGTVKMICEELSLKYNLPYEKIINSKELEVASCVGDIIGKDILICGVVNRDFSLLQKIFDSYSKDTTYLDFTKNINEIYNNYVKKIGKVFLTDSLYEYEKIDYKYENYLSSALEKKDSDYEEKLKRLFSVKRSLANMYSHKILFNSHELTKLITAYDMINSILNKAKKIDKTHNPKYLTDMIDEEYEEIISIENSAKKLINPIWHNFLTNASNDEKEYFNYLVATNIYDDVVEAKIISSDMIGKIKRIDLKYGFICVPKDDAVLYASTKPFEYVKDGSRYSVSSKSESVLQTPSMIVSSNIMGEKLSNEILLDKKRIYISGVYCIVDDELDKCSNYLKASVLAEDNNLPLVKIDLNENIKAQQR